MSTGFRKDIEGLRSLSIVLVLLYHAGLSQVPGGYVGVDVFFVVSGYLITGLLLREIETTGSIALFDFYAKRARRLLPASFTVLTFVAAVVFVVPRWFPSVLVPQLYGRSISWDIQRSALYIVNWLFAERSVSYQGSDEIGSPVLHFWSLAVEEQFYFVWPVLLLGVAVVGKRSRRVLGLAIAAVTILSLGWSIHMSATAPDEAYFVTTTRIWEMSLGGLGAFGAPRIVASAQRWRPAVRSVLATSAVAAIVLAAAVFDSTTRYPGYAALVPTLAALALVVVGVHGPLRSVFTSGVFQWVGARSYSLYLWHWPVLWLAVSIIGPMGSISSLLAIGIAFIPATLSFRYIEGPLRTGAGSRWSTPRTIVLAGATSVVGFALGAALLATTTGDIRRTPTPEPVTEVAGIQLVAGELKPDAGSVRYDVPEGYSNGCFLTFPTNGYHECSIGNEDSETTIVLFGNSHMAHWAPAYDALAERHGWHLIYIVHDGCKVSTVFDQVDRCETWANTAWERLPVVAAENDVSLVLTSPPLPNAARTAASIRSEYEPVFEQLAHLKVPAAIMAPSPRGKMLGVDCPSPAFVPLDECASPRAEALAHQDTVLSSATSAGIGIVDLTSYFCDGLVCPAVIDDLWVNRDDAHLTRVFALALTDALETEIASVMPMLVGVN